MPIAAETEKKLIDIDWSLEWFDFALDVISSNFETLKQAFPTADPAKGEIFADFQDIIGFKSSELYSTMMKIEELVLGTTQAFYRKYHGPFRDEEAGSSLAETQRNMIYSFESFLTQYKSLVDISIRFAFKVISAGKTFPKRIDSFERLIRIMDAKKEPFYTLINDSGMLSGFLTDKGELQDVKNYRDYIIHHAYLTPEKIAEGVAGHLFFKYSLPTLIQKGKEEYDIDTKARVQLDIFCRRKLLVLFTILATLTESLFTDKIREPHIKALRGENPELVKQVLVKIAGKEALADRVMNEDGLRAFLHQMGIEFGELAEESVRSERQFEGQMSYDGRDMSYSIQKVTYKPVGNVRIFKTSYVYDRDWKPPTGHKTSYGVTVTGVSVEDFFSGSRDAARILNHLRGCGIVYISNIQGAARYASIKDDLKALVLNLSELSLIKWSMIQIPEMNYFRARTQEETELTKAILGKDAEDYLKKEDQDRERIQEEYREWIKEPEHYYPVPLDIKRGDTVVQRISHQDFVAEKKRKFSNWKSDKIIQLLTRQDGSKDTIESRLLPEDMFTEAKLGQLIAECEKIWKEEPKHFLDFERESVKMHKERYDEDVKNAKKRFTEIIAKYDYLKPAFTAINKDVLQ
jgi:hypothetical protein